MKKAILNGTVIIAMAMVSMISVNAQNRRNVANCAGNQLSLKEVEGEADMGGKRFGNYVFTNISSKPCRMSGFPRFILLNKAGKTMRGVKVTYDRELVASNAETPVTGNLMLGPKQTAWFQVFYNDGFGHDLKKPVPSSAKVKITAPHTTRTFIIKSEINAYKNLQVSAVRHGLPQ